MVDDSKFSTFFFGFGIGLAVGILFAPKSGQETRDLLRAKADEGRECLKRASGDLKESAGEAVERGRTVLSKQKENLAAAVEAGKQAYRDAVTGRPGEEPGTTL